MPELKTRTLFLSHAWSYKLASAYSLTAHEIGIIESRLATDASENEWSGLVNEAELAFSREHTQWVARQDTFA